MKRALPLLTLLLLAASPASADPAPPGTPPPVPKPIHFATGKSSGTVKAAVIRGEQDFYSLGAKAGQRMTVTISAVESNAAFHIYAPGAAITRDAEGDLDVTGKALPDAEADATRWTGRLAASGTYLIEVGGTRGNATYALTVSIE